ncbi:MAG: hypothetical protein KIS63_24030, partial [Caldilineales bacterium]|nr:hypothetical protein [Caldilineales bacterium]
ISAIISDGWAICYSGYRDGQDPRQAIYPSYEEIRQDLLLLAKNWSLIRLYDCSEHAEKTLQVIQDEGLAMRVMLGVDMAAEMSNPNCPWGADFSPRTLRANRRANSRQVDRLIDLARRYPDSVFSVSAGNEAAVEWSDHLVSVDSLIGYVRRIKAAVGQPVTFCDNYVPWITKLGPLAAELDFISVHTYPVWEYRTIAEALDYSKANYDAVARRYPDQPVIITEAGWPTASNGRGIDPTNASEALQTSYLQQLRQWTQADRILTFIFEAFDEPWKGSPDALEPEKHWGLYDENRRPKAFMQQIDATEPA